LYDDSLQNQISKTSRPAAVITLSPTQWVAEPLSSINKLTARLRVVSSLEMHGNLPLVRYMR